jgi:hypothetical protein
MKLKNNFNLWKQMRKATAALALLGLVATSQSQAASIEATDAQAASGWAISVDARANYVGGNLGLIDREDAALDSWKQYLDKPIMAIKVQSPNGVVTFEGVFDLDILARRHTNMNDAADKYSSLDASPARHIIQELTAKFAATENLYVKAGLGQVNFMERERDLFATRPLQSNQELRERLFAEVGYTLEETGTSIMVSIFDGTEQRAVDVMGSLSRNDFIDIERLDDRHSTSASFAGRLVQQLGNTGLEASVGFAHINNIDNQGNDQQRLAIGLSGQYEVADWVIGGLIQFVRTFDQVYLSSTVAEVSASNGRLTAYLRGELAEVQAGSSTELAKLGTVGVQYDLVDTRYITASPFVELLVESRPSYDNMNIGLLMGVKVQAGYSNQTPAKTE